MRIDAGPDASRASWFHEAFGKSLDQHVVSQAQYVGSLGRLVLLAAQNESMVFVGRGAQFFLPREAGFAVRIIAPIGQRVKRVAERRQCSPSDAERFLAETDTGRAEFVRRYFHRDVADPHRYDLVVNLEYTSRAATADLILTACRLRFGPA